MAYESLCAFCTLFFCVYSVCASGYGDSGHGTRYGGRFLGQCDSDGMYYMDDNSYVMCSHSIAYIMPCAPGSRNSGRQLDTMQIGDESSFSAFCDVNLVDIGYAAFFSQQGQHNGGYGSSGGSTGHGSGGTTGYGGSSASTGYGGSSASTGYGGSSAGNTGYGKSTSYSTGNQPSYGQKASNNIVITYRKQYGQTKKTVPMYAPAPKPGYRQQQKSRPTYGQKQRARSYGQILGFGSGGQTRNTYSVGGYNNNNNNNNNYGSQTQRQVAAPAYQG